MVDLRCQRAGDENIDEISDDVGERKEGISFEAVCWYRIVDIFHRISRRSEEWRVDTVAPVGTILEVLCNWFCLGFWGGLLHFVILIPDSKLIVKRERRKKKEKEEVLLKKKVSKHDFREDSLLTFHHEPLGKRCSFSSLVPAYSIHGSGT